WPGNVRELANALERAVILADGDEIGPEHLVLEPADAAPAATPDGVRSLADLEREAIERALAAVGGNRKEAAERLGIGLRTLYDKLKRYRLEGGPGGAGAPLARGPRRPRAVVGRRVPRWPRARAAPAGSLVGTPASVRSGDAAVSERGAVAEIFQPPQL